MTFWIYKAACRGHDFPDLWTPLKADDPATEAKRICREECAVRLACGEWALRTGERHVVAGGYRTWDEKEQQELRDELPHVKAKGPRPKRRQVVCADCGATFDTTGSHTTCPNCRKGLVAAEPVRQRLLELRKVMTTEAIGTEINISPNTLSGIMSPSKPPKWVAAKTAERVMAFEPSMLRVSA